MSYDLAIVGGGIVGTAAAWRAAAAGASVVLIDREDTGRATDAGAGIVGAALNTRDRRPQYELAVAASRAYPDLVADLRAGAPDTGTGYEQVGLLAVAVDEGEVERFRSFEEIVTRRCEAEGHPTGHRLQRIEPDEAGRLYPALGPVLAALLDTGAARVDGRRITSAMRVAARTAGVEIRNESVGSLATVTAEAERVIIAGGAWSPRFGQELGIELPIEPQRGQIAHLAPPASLGESGGWPMLSLLTDQYQVPWPDGRVAVGATREYGSGFTPWMTAAGVRAVLDEALRAAPGLGEAELVEVRVGLRPVTPDLMPVIGPVPGHPRVIVASGHGPTGLTTGPYSGWLAADLALGHELGHDLSPFAVDRDFD